MSTTQVFKTHYTRLLTLWPTDPLRPSHAFTTPISRRAALYNATLPPSSSSSSSSTPPTKSAPSAPAPQLPASHELANLNALYSLLENRYTKTYALSPGVLSPASNPDYYDKLMEEIARAPGKGWWAAKWDEWKGKVRWS